MHLHYLDDDLVVVEKPAGMLSVPGRGPELADCVIARLQAIHADALTVHRLDMVTSGLLLHARGKANQALLSRQFELRKVRKQYVALVEGEVVDADGEVDLPLRSDWEHRPRQCVDRVAGRPALTRWRLLARCADSGRSLLALEPVTGRTHQLRVHLTSIGHPIVGDILYGAQPSDRVYLHAAQLEFTHPVTATTLLFESPAPFASTAIQASRTRG